MGIKTIKIFEDVPFEEGKTYMTKFATKQMFTVTKITVDKNGKQTKIEGVYVGNEDTGVCPISDRLIPDKKEIGEKQICDCCSFPVDEIYKNKK